jgi:hypothetical protein
MAGNRCPYEARPKATGIALTRGHNPQEIHLEEVVRGSNHYLSSVSPFLVGVVKGEDYDHSGAYCARALQIIAGWPNWIADRLYVVVPLIVLAVLLFRLLGGQV